MAVIEVTLTEDEFWEAVRVGAQRHFRSVCDGRRMRVVTPRDDGWRNHIEGACAELAAAKITGLKWHGQVDAFGKPDLGKKTDVKLRRMEDWELRIKQNEDPQWFYILMHGVAPNFKLRGYIKGSEAMRDKWYHHDKDKNCSYWKVPHEALHLWGGH